MRADQPRPCADRHPQLAGDDRCVFCRLARHDARYQGWRPEGFAPPTPVPVGAPPGGFARIPLRTLPCEHLGRLPTPEERRQHGLAPGKDWHLCERGHGFVCPCGACKGCGDYRAEGEPEPAPLPSALAGPPEAALPAAWPVRFDEFNLARGAPGYRFNASLAARGPGYALAYRTGWAGCEIYLVRLDAGLRQAGEPQLLRLRHLQANYGREDPRLFWHAGRLHVAFAGVSGRGGQIHTHQMYARLRDDLSLDQVFYPHLEGRQPWEKNWQFFEHAGGLYALYSVDPHRVLRVDGDRAEWLHEVPCAWPWPGWTRRGGAPPVRVGDEFWHFFHDWVGPGDPGGGRRERLYRTGLYTFAAEPPFAPRRYLPGPILAADPNTNAHNNYADVAFVGGAVRVGGTWLLAHGVHDRWSEVHAFAHADLERRLVPV